MKCSAGKESWITANEIVVMSLCDRDMVNIDAYGEFSYGVKPLYSLL